MGRLSSHVFGREKLPERCILYGGAYVPRRKKVVRRLFDKWTRIRGNWVKYTYVKIDEVEYLLVFNVYGGAIVLEVLHLLKDGGVRQVFFVGSMYAKRLPIGAIVIPSKIVDKAGPALVDNPQVSIVEPDPTSLRSLKATLKAEGIPHVHANTVSVPCALHEIEHVKQLIEKDENIAGVEMEVSTFYYFSRRLGLKSYALLYVSDNQKYGLISKAKSVWEARREAIGKTTRIALAVLRV